ncbi:MAG: helix-turn-helix transcriptional regulator [Sulfurisoma sp.]|nr:helix-turn-helix transcriptional regulator [Sulfurisoma sp.]
MFSNDETARTLASLGARLRMARLDRGDSQAMFATRIGVSIPTLRDMEKGVPTVAVGAWMAALWMLSRMSDADRVLEKQESLFARAARSPKPRQRASRKRSTA